MALRSKSSAHCSAINCSNRQSKQQCNLSFFRFPTEEKRCREWVHNTRRSDLIGRTPHYLSQNCRLCAQHFELRHFSNKKTKKRLNWNAVPTIFNFPTTVDYLHKRKPPKRQHQYIQQVVYDVKDHTYSKVSESDHDDDSRRVLPSVSRKPQTAQGQSSKPPKQGQSSKQKTAHGQSSKQQSAQGQSSKPRKKVLLQSTRLKKSGQQPRIAKARSDFIKNASAFLEDPTLILFTSLLASSSQRCGKAYGRRWTYKDKVLALSLYHQNPCAYQLWQHTFTFPSIPTLRKWLNNLEVGPGFPPKVFELLRGKVASMTESDKLCVITFDEMSLRAGLLYNITEDAVEGYENFGSLGRTSKPANHALVFMVRGLIGKWKQPIGYFLLRDALCTKKLKKLINKCCQGVKDIGLRPTAVVCDQGSSHVRLFERLSVTAEQPFFIHGADKIFCLHDPPHLLMDTISNLQKFVFQLNGEDDCKSIRWRYIQTFYEFDSQLAIRKAERLTQQHFDPSSLSKMRVHEAAEVVSHSVAAGMYTYTAFDKLPAEAAYTAEFIEMINNLFDALNSRRLKDPQKLKRPLSDNSEHGSFFELCLPILKNLKVVGGQNHEFINGWCLAIACVSQLWQYLKETTNVQCLMTSHLNQEVVENMFSTLRGKAGFRDNPSAKEFRYTFRMVMVDALIKPVSGFNCSTDEYIQTLCSLGTSNKRSQNQSQRVKTTRKASAVNNIPVDLPEQNTLAHIAEYLCRKVFTGHEELGPCQTCREALLKGNAELDNPALLFINYKAFDTFTSASDFGSLMVPSERFLAFCAECEKVFCTEFEGVRMTRINISNLLNHVMRELDLYKELPVCSERIKAKIVAIFVNVRMHYALKLRNKEFQDIPVKRKRRKFQTAGLK